MARSTGAAAAAEIEYKEDTGIVDVEALASDMATKLDALLESDPYTIGRVPAYIRERNKKLYEPMVIAIGPYHHGREHLQALEKHKWRFLRDLLSRSTTETSLEALLGKMKALEREARRSYSESIRLTSKELQKCTAAAAAVEIEIKYAAVIDAEAALGRRLHALPLSELYTFSRVPAYIREKSKSYYEPKSIAIGPYHHGREHLEAMEKHKLRYLRDLLYRSTTKASLGDLLAKMSALEEPARRSYSESIELASNEFVEMMLLDACFIIELFLKLDEGSETLSNMGRLDFEFIDMDLLLLENQIPFFIIEHLSESVSGGGGAERGETPSIISLLYKHMNIGVQKKKTEPPPPPEIHHLLHLYYHWFVLAEEPNASKSHDSPTLGKSLSKKSYKPGYVIPCATELREAGVRFRKKKSPRHILDIIFRNGVIEIPPIPILDFTKPFFTNLVAFEQSIRLGRMRMMSFSVLMYSLLKTNKDAEILRRCDVIDVTQDSEEEVVLFFNQLGKYLIVDPQNHYFADMFIEVNYFRDSTWHRHRARLVHDYFSNPWAILSLVGSLIVMALTFLQTFFTIYPTNFRPN
ncbi:UPF0481 protein At3g47200-like [Typha latifolia]|uniref:UPF0481 protein At3g47200-like n=1 Tax=Typha latifolia TaxID=4733 RepID=UPI003C2EFE11